MNRESMYDGMSHIPEKVERQVSEATPEACSRCSVQCDMGKALAKALIEKHLNMHIAESFTGEDGESFNEAVAENIPPELAGVVMRSVRSSIANSLDQSDKEIGALTQEMKDLGAACNGPLTMRASRDGITYTVSVCASPEVYKESTEQHLPSHIKAQPSDKLRD